MGTLTFRILGDLEVTGRNGPIRVGGRRRRTLLAHLLAHAGHRVSLDAICDAVWDGAPPTAAPSTVRTYLSQFRKFDVDGDGLRLEPDPSGYRVALDRSEFDVATFEDRLQAALQTTDADARLTGLDDALALWRGQALGEFADAGWARDEACRLSELRTLAIAERFDVLLTLGRHAECVAPLAAAVAAAPYDERLTAQLALAHYRAGHVAEALRNISSFRRRLGEELGLSPGPEIIDLERRMLERDPGLVLDPGSSDRETAGNSGDEGDRTGRPAGGETGPPAISGHAGRLPHGTVTFLFTDIVGSTPMLSELGDERYAHVLRRHRVLVTGAVRSHGGAVFGTDGDAMFCAFPSTPAAAVAAVEAQRALRAADWPIPLHVRMGMHVGEALVVDDDYVGVTVHVAARIASTAQAGQVVASDASRALAADADWIDLGTHRLKDVARPQRLHQLVVDADDEFPPLSTTQNVPTNLPEPLDSFVGRDAALEETVALLEHRRLVTFIGPGGVGKTRLATETGRAVRPVHPGGVLLVELAQLPVGGDVVPTVARSLIDAGARGGDLAELVTDLTSDGPLLLILDNCEHVTEQVARTAVDILDADAGVRLIATSREALHVRGEHVRHVDPLTVGDRAGRSAAAELFLARAVAATGRPVDEADLPLVERICTDLDGLPLAVEIAASRTAGLALVDIAQRLDDRFSLLRSARHTDAARHRTLRAVVDWSYELLPPTDRALFNRLSIFGDAFTLAAAEAVAGGDLVPAGYVIDGLSHLVDKSLVQLTTIDGGPTYRMLDTLRTYGRSRLAEARAIGAMEDRLLEWAMRIVDGLENDMRTARQDAALREMFADRGNLRTALDVQLARGRRLEALRIVASAPVDVASERCRLIDEIIPHVKASADDRGLEAIGRAHLAASNSQFECGNFEAGAEHARAGADIFGRLGDERSVAWACFLETFGAWGCGDEQRARASISEAQERFERHADRVGLANVAWVAMLLDTDSDRADQTGAWAEAELRSIDAPFALAHCLESRAIVDLRRGRLEPAGPRLIEALGIFGRLRNQGCVAHCLEAAAAHVASTRPDALTCTHVAELLGAAEGLRTSSGHRHRPWEVAGQRAALAALRATMSLDDIERAMTVGSGHRLDSAVALATRLVEG